MISNFWTTAIRTLFWIISKVHFPVRKNLWKLLGFSLWIFLISYFQSMAEEALEAVSKNRKSHLNIDNVSQTGSKSSLALSEASQGKSIKWLNLRRYFNSGSILKKLTKSLLPMEILHSIFFFWGLIKVDLFILFKGSNQIWKYLLRLSSLYRGPIEILNPGGWFIFSKPPH